MWTCPLLTFEQVFLLSDAIMKQFEVRWPFRGIKFNCDDRRDMQALLNDISAIWEWALTTELELKRSDFKVRCASSSYVDIFNGLHRIWELSLLYQIWQTACTSET